MIYILLSKSEVLLQKKIIEYIRINIKNNNFLYKIIFNNQHIIESDLENIDNEKDIVLWHPLVAYHNLEIIKNFSNSIVILDKATLYVQKISELNPISENLAINNGFYIIYINPDDKDITNDEYKLVVNEDMYLMNINNLLEMIRNDETNLKDNNKIIVEDIFESITSDIIRNQINLST